MRPVHIEKSLIGSGRTYVIAEIGSNHNQDLGLAKELIDAAADAGVDAVKFQAFRAVTHYSRHAPDFSYLKKQKFTRSTYDLIASLEINPAWHASLMKHARKRKVAFLSSPCDAASVDQLGRLGMPAFKLASFDLPALTLIRHMARYGRPLIFSTGMASYSDIERAIAAAREKRYIPIVLLQCTSLYPAPVELSNLHAMRQMAQAFDVPVGYSDHTMGEHICLAAVALGACMLEKHFTLNRKMKGPDHSFAIEPDELKAMVGHVRDVETARGDGLKNGPRPAEMEMFKKGRRSLHVTRSLRAGDAVGTRDLCIKRPGLGIPPFQLESVVGLRLTRDVEADHWLTWEDFK